MTRAILALAVALLLAGGAGATNPIPDQPASSLERVSPPRAAPALAGHDPITGRFVSLAQFRGRPVVINIWSSWCEGCRIEAAEILRFQRTHRGVLMGVDIEDSRASARRFFRRHGYTFPSIFDPQGRLAARLGRLGLPNTFFLDRRHRIVARYLGAAPFRALEEGYRLARASG